MNKRIKSIIATVTVLVLGAFSLNYLHAEEVKAYDQCSGTYKTYTSEMKKPIKESKLTDLRYAEKVCPVTFTLNFKKDHLKLHGLGDNEGFYVVFDDFSAAGFPKGTKVTVCTITRDAELYGRVEAIVDGGMLTLNLHDDRARIKYPKGEKDRPSSEEIEEITAEYKEAIITLNTQFSQGFKAFFEELGKVDN